MHYDQTQHLQLQAGMRGEDHQVLLLQEKAGFKTGLHVIEKEQLYTS